MKDGYNFYAGILLCGSHFISMGSDYFYFIRVTTSVSQ